MFTDTDFHIILLSALRYALHRHSYVPSTVAGYIARNWASIPSNTQNLIIRDLQEHLAAHADWQFEVITAIDYSTWQDLYTTLTKYRKEQQ